MILQITYRTKICFGKISAALGNTSFDHKDDPLFTTTLDDLQSEYQSEVSGIKADSPTVVTSEYLTKIWSVTNKQASDILEYNTQLNRQSNDSMLSRQLSTNDRMLRYQRIESFFFTDILLVTKAAKSTWGSLY